MISKRLFAIGAAVTLGTSGSASAQTNPFDLRVRFENVAETRAGSSPISRDDGPSNVAAHSLGPEKSGCGVTYGRKSAANATAAGSVTVASASGVGVSLQSSAVANGGHYRAFTACVGGIGLGISGRDTTARAVAVARAIVAVRFTPDAPRNRYFVRVDSTSTGTPLILKLVSGRQTEVALSTPDGSPPVIEGESNKTYFLNVELPVSVQNAGNSSSQRLDASGTVQVSIEAAPVAFGMSNTPLIAGGFELGPNDYPEVGALSIKYEDGVRFHCTGTLLTPTTVLTAAHCIHPYEKAIEDGRMVFTTGKLSTSPKEGPITVASYRFPTGAADQAAGFAYNKDTYEDDIGLLYLSGPITKVTKFPKRFSSPTDLPGFKENQASLTIVGFGYMKDPTTGGLIDAGVKRYVTVPLSDYSNRRLVYQFSTAMGGACKGDSGGPTYLTQKRDLIGVTSTGAQLCDGQGEQVRIDGYEAWVAPKIKP